MSADFPSIVLFIIFEFLILLSSIRFFYLITKNCKNTVDAESIISWISFSLIITILIASLLSFSQNNGVIQYLTIAVLITIILHINKKSELLFYLNYLVKTFTNIFMKILNWKTIIIISALLPVLFITMKPIDSADSLYFLTFMLDWSYNQEIPYVRGYDYPPVWELSYIPSIVLTTSDNFFWVNSFKPLIIVALGTYLIGREIKLPNLIIWASVFSSVLYFQFWVEMAASISTLKNDVIFAAGIILLIFSMIRSLRLNFGQITGIFFILGIIFVTIKPSGILLGLIATVIFVIINRKRLFLSIKKTAMWVAVSVVAFSLLAGNYYLYNTLEFGNPLYPGNFELFGLKLEGYLDFTGTRIIDHLDDERVWNVFFPSEKISRGGLLFPVLTVFGFAGSLGFLVFSALRFIKNKKFDSKLIIISLLILITWTYYLFTPLAASNIANPEGLTMLVGRELFTTRYIFATLFVTELFLYYILWRLKIPNIFIFSLVGINIISRYWILWEGFQNRFDFSLIIFPLIVLIGIFLFGRRFRKFVPHILLFSALSISILIFSPFIVEENRKNWIPPWDNVILYLQDLPPSEIFLIDIGQYDTWTYPVYGNKFQHSIEIGNEDSLFNKLSIDEEKVEETGAIQIKNKLPTYVAKLCRGECGRPELLKLELELSEYGYERVAIDFDAILLKNKG